MKFLTLEGVDGAGKSSHIEFIADAIRTKGVHVIVTREPGGTELAERLRQTILSHPMSPILESLLIFAARTDHVERVIKPALASGQWVICDRFTDATAAYQGAGKGVSAELIARLAKAGRALDRFEREDRAFFERVRGAYLALAKREPQRMVVIDASRDSHGVREQIRAALASL